MGNAACQGCGFRWAQVRGLCNTCRRERGLLPPYGDIIRTDQAARVDQVEHVLPPMAPNRTIIVAGVEYDIVWDGT